jgi:hypothetical protein
MTSKLECITNFGPIGGATLCVVAFLLYFLDPLLMVVFGLSQKSNLQWLGAKSARNGFSDSPGSAQNLL